MPSIPGTPVLSSLLLEQAASPATITPNHPSPMTADRIMHARQYSSSPYHRESPFYGNTPSPHQSVIQMRQSAGFGSPQARSGRSHGTPPDRFIPSSTNLISFRMGTPVENLTPDERIVRRHVPGSRDRSTSPDTPTNQRRGTRDSPLNRRISAGAVGVFGLGLVPGGPIAAGGTGGQIALPPRQRGLEVNGGIFADQVSPKRESSDHALRISAALGVDTCRRVFNYGEKSPIGGERAVKRGGVPGSPAMRNEADQLWASVVEDRCNEDPGRLARESRRRIVPSTPFRVLDAPGLRDDYYCSLVAYSNSTHSLAVGLHSDVYIWHESRGARPLENWNSAHVTSLAFSSPEGKNNILAIGRIDGNLSLWEPSEANARLEHKHEASIACVAWKPVKTYHCKRDIKYGFTENLLVGDESGQVYLYAVSWGLSVVDPLVPPTGASVDLLRRISVHTQQICGLAWSPDGEQFATGGNDNAAFLFNTAEMEGLRDQNGFLKRTEQVFLEGGDRHRWHHGAAVKAIAFCPWQKTLLATGGGSNDRCIHFFHTTSGATLRTINVAAQVTSLLWSNSHREIAATLGYANPEHAVRIVVYNWPDCHQVVQVMWQEDMRALYAVAFPGGPTTSEGSRTMSGGSAHDSDSDGEDEDGFNSPYLGGSRKARKKKKGPEGCIVVAASDETVRFHEVWSDGRRAVLTLPGVLVGSNILEGIEGIESDGAEMIR